MQRGLLILGALVLILAMAGCSLVGRRNDLVRQREAVDGQYAQIDNAIQRRADLIPNLVESTKGIAKQEQAVFGRIAEARAALGGAATPEQRVAADNRLAAATRQLVNVIVENYPQLQSSQSFQNLQVELAGAENRIAVERGKYNELVRAYNVNVDLFPNNIAAAIFGFQKDKPYFNVVDPASRTAPPKVQF